MQLIELEILIEIQKKRYSWNLTQFVNLYVISKKSTDSSHKEEQKGKVGQLEITMYKAEQLSDVLVEVVGRKGKRQLGSPQRGPWGIGIRCEHHCAVDSVNCSW